MIKALTILKNPKAQLLLLLALLAGAGLIGSADWQSKLIILMISFAIALLAEWAFFGFVPTTSIYSAAITGLIIGVLFVHAGSLLPAWFASVTAIASKKLFVFREGKHIFNPAVFGLVSSILVFGNHINWWGNSSFILIIIGGGLILFRLNRLSLPFSYFCARVVSAAVMGGFGAIHDIVILPNLFFAFIMLVEPKTSPGKRAEQWIFGGLSGILATLFFRLFPAYEGDLLALLIVNALRPLMTLRHYSADRINEVCK